MLATKSNSYTFQKTAFGISPVECPLIYGGIIGRAGLLTLLRTKSIRDARVRAMSDAAKLDRHWHILRISSDDLPGKHLLDDAVQESAAEASIDDHSLRLLWRFICA